jgi:phage-related protein
MKEKDLLWRGSSYKDLLSFPDEPRRDAGYQLGFVQLGFEPSDWKPMSSIGQGVKEIRIHVEGEFRVIYIAKYQRGNLHTACLPKEDAEDTQEGH